MTLKNTYKFIAVALMAVLAPVATMAFTGTPTISLNGASDIGNTYATITVMYDSHDAVYEYNEQPVVYVEYTNTKTGDMLISAYGSESYGVRAHPFGLYDLEKGTQYSYRGVMKYSGNVYKTATQTFTTAGVEKTPSVPVVTKTTEVINTTPIVITDTTTKIVAKAKSSIMTGGATHKNGVAIAITDEQARTSVGDSFTFTVQYQNTNKDSLKNGELVIQLPEQYEFVKSSFDMDYNEHDNTVTYIAGRVPNGVVKTVTFTARAIGDGSGEVKTTATLFYEGGSISASDRDSFHGDSKSALGASVFGAGFFPQTMVGWIVILLIITSIIIIARRYMTAPVVSPESSQKAA